MVCLVKRRADQIIHRRIDNDEILSLALLHINHGCNENAGIAGDQAAWLEDRLDAERLQVALDDRSLAPRYTSSPTGMPLPVWNEVLKRSSAVLAPPQIDALNDLFQQAVFMQAQSVAFKAYNKKK